MTTTDQARITQIMRDALLSLRYCAAHLAGAPTCDCGRNVWDEAAQCWITHLEHDVYIERDEAGCGGCHCQLWQRGVVTRPGVLQLPGLCQEQPTAQTEVA